MKTLNLISMSHWILTSALLTALALPAAAQDANSAHVLRIGSGPAGKVYELMGPICMIEESGRIPILDLGTIAMVKQGKIRVLPAVQEILPDRVRFAGGAAHPFEAIIFATGYTPNLGNVIEGFEKIADARGRPHRFGEETGIAGLYFVGFKSPPTGALREIVLEAPRVARVIRTIVGSGVAMDALSATTAG